MEIVNRGTMVMPAELRIGYDDGTSDTVRLPVEIVRRVRAAVGADYARAFRVAS